ncbi:NAD-dependent epimerase/dehydratase family protein [Paenibacillus sp. NPDC058071]|uniref:NAD-dependent epimerase/dehydratase family protein n=1 Tax=Paenibacillus sp. NPDC058071 TaxID=3346326 RepID=UPI0036DF53B6
MNVLVTGGYGFIGSFVAERFYKEGHKVIIIDNLTSGHLSNCGFPHVSYIADVESTVCDSIFDSHNIDIVVHLAAQINVVTSMDNPYADTKSNILGLTNILQLAAKHKVRKFLFASSAAVYGLNDQVPLNEDMPCQPVSPYGINKLLGEYYCTKWSEIYKLDTICFRFANVYGPRQGSIGEGGVVSIFMERVRHGLPLDVYGDGSQTRDFVYVEDVAEVIYLASLTDQVGLMNLSTNTENSVSRLIGIMESLHPVASVQYKPARNGDIHRSRLDNSRLKDALNWDPRYGLEEGLKRTFDWFMRTPAAVPHIAAGQEKAVKLDEGHIYNELMASSLSRNIRSIYLSQPDRYLDGLPVLKPEVFLAVIRSREQAKLKFNVNYSFIALQRKIIIDGELLFKVNGLLRESDFIGQSFGGDLFILLSNSTKDDAAIVANRLLSQRIDASVLQPEQYPKWDLAEPAQ